ncbi:non-ribosomal peptide synthetase [Actinokineospora globicatena]|uniref:non-ribosomal peptide synthetase n=1 Tax=Actinokineospora globicatena TaxID=103729 RepID=UPI0020A30EA5|nr:amino acid adenylation domain-containing protein [Actinokineospora globicatena]MCP2303904.1 amino acid adenylation domain-containing protein [Actinokineospora globicatena]GLW78936.1 hypothetical protein Aglo01_34180 [Actinokineospora globicatena]GLW86652.1 hypothetical protein Aglo02_42910 [Actinokineospora globicatena]
MSEEQPYPPSHAQRGLWFLHRLHGPDTAYHLPVAVALDGDLDVAALRAALADLVRRHEPLRTVFPEVDGEPVQVVLAPEAARPGLAVVVVPEAELDESLRDAASTPFDIERVPPLRATLFTLAPDRAVLLLTLHHIAADGWSMRPLLADLSAAYRSHAGGQVCPNLADPPIRYADYALWQRELLGSRDDPESLGERQVSFWRDTLAGLGEVLRLPVDRPRLGTRRRTGAHVPIQWPARRHRAVAELARAAGCSVFMVVHAALAALVTRLGAGTDIPIGTVLAGRTEDGLADLVGLFANTVVVRVDTSGDPAFLDLLHRVREVDLDAQENQDLPFDRVVEALNPPRGLAHHPLFQVMLVLENVERADVDFGSVSARPHEVVLPAAKVDLTFQLVDHYDDARAPRGLSGYVEYAVDLFDEDTVVALVDRLALLVDIVTAEPGTRLGDIDVLLPGERTRVLSEWVSTARPYPVDTLHGPVWTQARRCPGAVAVVDGARETTYADLVARADRLAGALAGLGVRPGSVVAIALPRSTSLVVALMAVLRAGAAYLPLDPDVPPARVAHQLRDASPACVVAGSDGVPVPLAPGVPVLDITQHARWSLGPLPATTDPLLPAYVLYTSGTTGAPKGVVVAHRAIDNRLRWMQENYGLVAGDRVLHKTPVGFDVSIWELFWPLRTGATLVLAAPGEHRDPARLARLIVAQRVAVAHFVPSVLREFLAEPVAADCTGLRWVVCSGEELTRDLVDRCSDVLPGVVVDNLYGPTEAAVDVTAHRCAVGEVGAVPIGEPIANTGVRVLDERLRPCPVGVVGQLYLTGVQLADGYVGNTPLTASRFCADPHGGPGERMYWTGDLARWRADGALVYAGRDDRQVKLRGQRLELDEVEAVLLAASGVAAACAVLRDDQRLAVYAVGAADRVLDPAALRLRLAARLPAGVLPDTITVLDSLPLGTNGKVDRSALPAPSPASAGTTGRPPGTPTEVALARVFCDLLDLPQVRVDDDFFALGGHSMLAIRLVRAVRAATGADLPVEAVFRSPTVAALAGEFDRPGPGLGEPVLVLRATGEADPVFFVHPGTGLSWCYYRVLDSVPRQYPVYALQSRGLEPDSALPASLAEIVDDYVARVRAISPRGPYRLLGWSFGGIVAHAVAARLRDSGEEVPVLLVFDSFPNAVDEPPARERLLAEALVNLAGGRRHAVDDPRAHAPVLAGASDEVVRTVVSVGVNNLRIHYSATHPVFDGDLTLVAAASERVSQGGQASAWREHATGRVDVRVVDCEHHEMFTSAAAATGAVLHEVLAATTTQECP